MKRNAASEPQLAAKNETEAEIEPKKPKIDDSDNTETMQVDQEKPKPALPSGRQIIQSYIDGDVAAAVTYRKICNAFDTFECWEREESKVEMLQQFLCITDVLDLQADQLVRSILKLRWETIPSSIIDSFRSFLFELAVRQICFTDVVINSVLQRFSPETVKDEETKEDKYVLDEKQRTHQYHMAHHIMSNIVRCFPMCAKILLKAVKSNFPHFTQPPKKVGAYVRNLIILQKYAPTMIAKELWEAIFNRISRDDIHNWRCDQKGEETNTPALFALNDVILIDDVESEAQNVEENMKGKEVMKYLDSVCTDLIVYINHIHGIESEEEKSVDASWITDFTFPNEMHVTAGDLFESFKFCLESVMLTATHVHHISFIWLYICSLEPDYQSRMLEYLWHTVCKMPLAPADSKKSQGAAAYLAAFLARANYIDKKIAFDWLEEMFEWLRRYVDQFGSGSSQIQPGLHRHGTFYAIAQSFFLVFAFRYKDFVKSADMMESIRRWGVGRVVHSSLEPLRFVSRPVARCFSAITRSLQLVYCNHVIPIEEVQRPFEDMFPFDSYNLKMSSAFVTKLMRKFSPLAEDVSILAAALSWNAATAEKQNNVDGKSTNSGELDFLDDDDFGPVSRERSGTCGQSSLINYSATPGLKTFGNA